MYLVFAGSFEAYCLPICCGTTRIYWIRSGFSINWRSRWNYYFVLGPNGSHCTVRCSLEAS